MIPIIITKKNRKEATYGAGMSHYKYAHIWKKPSYYYNWFTGYHGEAGVYQYLNLNYKYAHHEYCGDGGLDGKDFQVKTITKEDGPLSIKIDDSCLSNKKVKYIYLVYFVEDKHGEEIIIKGKISVKEFMNKSTYIEFKEKDGSITKKRYLYQNKLDKV